MSRKILISISIREDQKSNLEKEDNMSKTIRDAIDFYYESRGENSDKRSLEVD